MGGSSSICLIVWLWSSSGNSISVSSMLTLVSLAISSALKGRSYRFMFISVEFLPVISVEKLPGNLKQIGGKNERAQDREMHRQF